MTVVLFMLITSTVLITSTMLTMFGFLFVNGRVLGIAMFGLMRRPRLVFCRIAMFGLMRSPRLVFCRMDGRVASSPAVGQDPTVTVA